LWAVGLVADRERGVPLDAALGVGSWIREWCYRNGMILRNNGDILVIAPSLIISRAQADEMLALMERAMTAAAAEFGLG